jgi:hypothetical protein
LTPYREREPGFCFWDVAGGPYISVLEFFFNVRPQVDFFA